MKKISLVVLVLSFITITYFFVKEQFRGVALSPAENMILTGTYFLVAIALIILFRIKDREKKNSEDLKK